MNLYTEIILDHYKNPHNKGRLKKPHATAIEHNRTCGDKIRIDLKFDKTNLVTEVSFEGVGCAISQAAASMLTDKLLGLPKDQIAKFSHEKMLKLLAIPIGPGRLKCALLALYATKKAILP
ncbi:MAG: SUF system NifU family Fe-S cluster assembly protein [Candidatus Gracilibacteria bacterium]